jgi:hypothetical protein
MQGSSSSRSSRAVLLAGCGGGQATAPADPGTLAGTSAGPYGLSIVGTGPGAGGGMTDMKVGVHEPGGTVSFDSREIGGIATQKYGAPPPFLSPGLLSQAV